MKTLLLLALLATLAAFSLLAEAHSDDANDSPDSEAFVSKQESAQVVKRHKQNYDRGRWVAQAATPDPWEAHREVCELNPACDELADQLGFQEAYRRFYGPL